ncbi:ParB N-terminal domain-containing protein [Tumebacillus sp. ITR2]|uniref:ParB N-terminal domain-containing protein n=1 Tax=Tumebacillus amylolyticus TaxID=2801339 RepID=A0ABS1JFQ1_9BACL|nr:ParB/RepB/Spo0J family partition protein [Tumebacillus amylolyticus]MBL0388408.1 ParB N-terminal domain-containing protein [Tumebacillus amylolyticus]
MKLVMIPIQKIRVEDSFRKTDKDDALTERIIQNGLHEPLLVEVNDDEITYTLVEGYRRYESLKQLKQKEVLCYVESPTSPELRVLKRLEMELSRKKKTGFGMERQVAYLLERGYTVERIAAESKVSISTIKKYTNYANEDKDEKRRAEEAGVGWTGYRELKKLANVYPIVQSLLEKYINKKFVGDQIYGIKKVLKQPHFSRLPEKLQEVCLDQTIAQTKFTDHNARKIVSFQTIRHVQDEQANAIVLESVLEDLQMMKSTLSPQNHFMKNLDKKDKKKLQSEILVLAQSTGLILTWNNFPSGRQKES